LTRIHCWDNC